MVQGEPWGLHGFFSSREATVEIRVVRLGSFQNLYLSFAIVEITHGVTANRDDNGILAVKKVVNGTTYINRRQ